MFRIFSCFISYLILNCLIRRSNCVIYTYEDIELRRIFPSEFPQDTIRKSGSLDPEHLGRYAELQSYFKYPKAKINSHFEELLCYDKGDKKMCRIDAERYSPAEDAYYLSTVFDSHVDKRRVYCFMLLCFTEDELDRVIKGDDVTRWTPISKIGLREGKIDKNGKMEGSRCPAVRHYGLIV